MALADLCGLTTRLGRATSSDARGRWDVPAGLCTQTTPPSLSLALILLDSTLCSSSLFPNITAKSPQEVVLAGKLHYTGYTATMASLQQHATAQLCTGGAG